MARIPVARVQVEERRDDERERKGGIPLWVWPLIPLLLGALALGMSLRGDDNNRAGTNAGNTAQGTGNTGNTGNTAQDAGNAGGAAAGNAVTDMLQVVNDGNQASYAGRPASFANVTVQSVVGDRGFWVGPNADQQLFVVMDEKNVGRSEGQIEIAPGQVLNLQGQIEQLPPVDQAPAEWGLNASNSAALANQQVYLHANQITAGQ